MSTTWAVSPSGQSTLGIGTALSVDQLLATGGTFLADFANDVVLTFNGPNGFSADVSSSLLYRFSQSIFQRDIVLERLTQVERNVVYEARSFARFRKTLFRDLGRAVLRIAADLPRHRDRVAGLLQQLARIQSRRSGIPGRAAAPVPGGPVRADTLEAAGTLISSCNGLEQALDRLKIEIGLPPELPLNLDLTELDQLTLRDEVTAVAERVRRARQNLIAERRAADAGTRRAAERVRRPGSQDAVGRTTAATLGRRGFGARRAAIGTGPIGRRRSRTGGPVQPGRPDDKSRTLRQPLRRLRIFQRTHGPGQLAAGAHLASTPRGGSPRPGLGGSQRNPPAHGRLEQAQ